MNILYIFTVILIIGLHMLLYKKEQKQSICLYLALTLGLLLCYNIVICVILSFIKIKCTLMNLSILNVFLVGILGIKIIKDKKIQKYFVNKIDILAILLIIIITILILKMQYGIPIGLRHTTTDGITHCCAAIEFNEYSNLLMEKNSELLNYLGIGFLMPGAYINTGIILKLFSASINETYFCKIYILFDLAMWALSGILMYAVLTKNENNEKKKIIPLVFSIIYMLGYPLNSLISGFSYLQMGLNIIICILLIMKLDVNRYYKYLLMFMANFGLMFSYYYFVPIVFLAFFIQIIKDKNKPTITINKIAIILFTLVIPGLFGIMYFIIFLSLKTGDNVLLEHFNYINIPGPIYENLITTTIIFGTLSFWNTIKSIKNKKIEIIHIAFICTILFIIIMFIGMKLQMNIEI